MGNGLEITEKTDEDKKKSQKRFYTSHFYGLFQNRSIAPFKNPAVRRRKWARRAVISLGLLLTIFVVIFFSLPKLLIAAPDITKSDVILHGSISPQSKADEYVADLYRQGLARKIVCVSSQVSWELYPGDYARDHLISLGVPSEDVISLRLPISPCEGVSIPKIVDYVKANGWRSVLIITHPEDSRYSARQNRKFFEKEGIATAVGYAPEDRNTLTQYWWSEHWKTQRMIGEVMNITIDQFYSECR